MPPFLYGLGYSIMTFSLAYTVAVVKNFYRLKNPAHKTLSNAGPNTTGPQLMIDSGSPKEAKNMGKLIASTMRLIASTNSKKTVQITSNITFIIFIFPLKTQALDHNI